MPGISRQTRQDLLDYFFGISTWSQPADIYIALYTTAPTSTGGGVEVSAGGYERKLFNTCNTATVSERPTATNNGNIEFPLATEDWGNIVAYGFYDSLTGGNFLGYGNMTISKEVSSGDYAVFQDGDLSIVIQEYETQSD